MTATTTKSRKRTEGAGSLTKPEADRLTELEEVIERGLETFLEVGQALMEIRNSKLYRETHGTFNHYVRQRFGFTDRRARQLMQAAKVGTTVPVTNEAQARELGRAPEELMQDVWTKAEELAKKESKKGVTVALIKEARRIARWNFDVERSRREREERAFRMQLSPRGFGRSWAPAAPVNIPAAIEASERNREASEEIRLVRGPWTADGTLPEHRRIPESNTVKAWREKLTCNGNGSAPRDLRKIIGDIEKLRATLPADSLDHAALAKALEVLGEVA